MAMLLGTPTRLAIIEQLLSGPMLVSALVKNLREAQATVSKQLAVMRKAGILSCRPDGRCREYAVADPRLVRAAIEAMDALGADCEARARKCRGRKASGIVAEERSKNEGQEAQMAEADDFE